MEHLPLEVNNKFVYATFSQRLLAGFIDMLVFLSLMFVYRLMSSNSISGDLMLEFVVLSVPVIYTVLLNYYYGGTLGKLAQGIRITQIDGSKISFVQSLLRSSVDIIITLVLFAITVVTLTSLGLDQLSEYFYQDWFDRSIYLMDYYPDWEPWVENIMLAWYWSELLVMLTNERRRALHDFIADSVVIKVEFCKNK